MKREYDFSKAKRGPVIPVPRGKTRVTIRLDEDVIDWFRQQVNQAGGGNYQSLINDALRQHIARSREPLEEILRRVIRGEIIGRVEAWWRRNAGGNKEPSYFCADIVLVSAG